MSSILSVAQSGLQLAAQRLAVSANNVANALTDGFVPSQVVAEEVAGGGVRGRVVTPNDPGVEGRIDGAIVGLSSRADLAEETVSQMQSAAAFRANLASLRTSDDLLQAVLDLRA
jgi:flagellar basal-body rod protein FlgC